MVNFLTDKLDKDAIRIVKKLQRNGFKAYLVGGCVRDSLLGVPPKDFDVVTGATPEEIRALFSNSRIIGRRFRLVHVFFGHKEIQTATFRKKPENELSLFDPNEQSIESDNESSLLIRSDNTFGTEKEDAYRRDFTINGLFYDPVKNTLIDHIGGLPDIYAKQIRTIGDPHVRFQEDPVRMLRAVRFAAKLGFEIEESTYQALVQYVQLLGASSKSRLLDELFRFLRSGHTQEALCLLEETGLLNYFLPNWSNFYRQNDRLVSCFFEGLDRLTSQEEPYNSTLLAALCGPQLSFFFEPNLEHRQPLWYSVFSGMLKILTDMPFYKKDIICLRQILIGEKALRQRSLFKGRRRKNHVKESVHYPKETRQLVDFYFLVQKIVAELK